MSHELVPNGEAEGGPEHDAGLPDALLAPLYVNPCVGDDAVPDESPNKESPSLGTPPHEPKELGS